MSKGAPRCEGARKDGARCNKAAVVDIATIERHSQAENELAGRLCLQHLLGPDERRELARRGGKVRAAQRRAEASPRPRSGLDPALSMDIVYRAIADGVTATYADCDLPAEKDYTSRLLACAALLNLFPRGDHRTPEQVREILERALPQRVRAELGARLTPQTIQATARAEWDELKARRAPLTKVYAKDPPWLTVV